MILARRIPAVAVAYRVIPGTTLLTALRRAIRLRHYSRRTEEVYVGWVRRFVKFCGRRHPREVGQVEVTQFLSSLATEGKVSASTQNQALSALVFVYGEVLGAPVGWLGAMVQANTTFAPFRSFSGIGM